MEELRERERGSEREKENRRRERESHQPFPNRERESIINIYMCVWELRKMAIEIKPCPGLFVSFLFWGEKRFEKKKNTTNIRREFSGVEPKDFLLVAK